MNEAVTDGAAKADYTAAAMSLPPSPPSRPAPRPAASLAASQAVAPAGDGGPLLSVVIPAHDEASNLPTLVEEVAAALRPLAASLNASWEVIVVDDASGDHTPAALRGVATAVPELRVLRHRRQSGQSAGLLTGIRAARGVWIATLDGDGQNDPADIPALWRALQAVPVGARPLALIAGHRTARRDSAIRRLSSRMANGVRRRILQDDTPDTGCGLKLFARDAFMALPHFDHMHRFLPALVQRAGGQSHSVPVNHRPRGGGRSHYGIANRLWVGIVDLMGVAWLLRRQRLPGPIEEMNRSENRP